MKRTTFTLAILALALLLPALMNPARAQYGNWERTWVAATGEDDNVNGGCQPSAPCQTFATALLPLLPGGEINCLGPAGGLSGGTVTITKTLTIDCHGTFGGHSPDGSGNGFTINAAGDVVTLRGLSINGGNGPGVTYNNGTTGILIEAAAVVNIEDCVIENFSQVGISDARTGGGTRLFIKNTVIRNNAGAGIVAAAAATNSVVLENVQSIGNKYGIAVATGNHVVINRSVMSENTTAGVETDPGGQASVDNTEITHNVVAGIQAFGTVTLANAEISYNSTGISGATSSYGNNRIFANSTPGTTPTPIGGASTDYGQK